MKYKKCLSLLMAVLILLSLLPIPTIQAEEKITVEEGLIAHYDMSKAEGKLIDVTNNGFDAEYVGFKDEDSLEEYGDTILNFNGEESKYVKLPAGLIDDETFTIETTFNTGVSAAHWLYSIGTKTGSYPNVKNYIFFNPRQGNGTIRFGIKDSDKELLFQDATIQPREYNTFTATFKQGEISLYLNGEPIGTLPHSYSVMDILKEGVDPAADSIGFIGKSLYEPDAAFSGKLADFKVYNYTLSAEEVKQNVTLTDEEIVELAEARLAVPNADDIRGNITLPTTSSKGATITWETDRPDVINVTDKVNENYDDIPAGVVTRQDKDTEVKLTATISSGEVTATKTIPITVKAKSKEKNFTSYLMTHFTGEHDIGEQIYFASSEDGLHWTDLNDGDPALLSNLGEKGVRDPYLLRSAEGDKFYMLATDLRIANGKGWGAAQREGSKSLIIWESTDLVNWSEPRMVEVAPENAGNAWAPEAFYDERTGEYIVFWASTTRNDQGIFEPHNIYYAKTRDFHTFTEPKVFIDRPGDQNIIDTTIIEDGDMYYRYSGDGQITIEKSNQLLGTWSKVGTIEPSTGLTGGDVEGPLIFKFNDREEWNLMVDQYASGKGYLPLLTTDLSSGDFTRLATSDYSLGSNKKRHGSVLPITKEEHEAIMAKWNKEAEAPDEEEQEEAILEYNFEETTTDKTIEDHSGNNYSGALHGNAKYLTDVDKDSKVLYLNGTANTFAAFPTGFFDGRDTVSISMDIKPETVSGNFFTFTIGKNDQKYMFLRTRDTEIRNAITVNSWSNEQEVKANTSSIKGKWMNIKLVMTPTSMKMYKDGILVAENNDVTLAMKDLGADLSAYLGKSFYSGDQYFKGYFDNVKVYNRALSEDEILEMTLEPTGIGNFEVPGQKGQAEIDKKSNTITVHVKEGQGIDVTNLTPTITLLPSSTVSPASGKAQDFTNPVTYTVTDKDGNKQEWSVKVEIHPASTLPGLYADPQIAVFGDTYYLYPTTDGFDGWSGSSFKAFSSKDLINWKDEGVILDLASDDVTWADSRAWAPGIAEKDGIYYYYFSADANVGVASSTSPTGPFKDALGKPLVPSGKYPGQAIDPYAFKDDDGQYYFYWGNGSLFGAKLNEDMVSFAETPVDMTPANFREAPVVFKRNGIYYLMWSEDDTGSENYQVAYATGTSPMGPWTKKDVILSKDLSLGIKGPGHHSILNIPNTDEYYIVYARHAIPDGNGFNREVVIDKMEFNDDGTIKKVKPTLRGITEPVYVKTPELDISKLKSLIDEAKSIKNEGKYTEATFAALQEAISIAEKALKESKTEEELDSAIAALQSAINGLLPLDELDTSHLLSILEEHQGDLSEKDYRSLVVHLTAVSQFEKKGAAEKVIKHMETFKKLLDYQLENELITQELYEILKANANSLIQKWEGK